MIRRARRRMRRRGSQLMSRLRPKEPRSMLRLVEPEHARAPIPFLPVKLQPSASYSLILRTETSNQPGTLGRVATAIGQEGGDIGAIDIVRTGGGKIVRDITVAARDEAHSEAIVNRVRELEGITVLHTTDRTFLLHLGGKIEVHGRVPVKGRDDLSMVYTPGVGRICLAIRDDPAKQW